MAWLLFPLLWALLIPVGAFCAILVPVNLVLVPCWLAAASSVGVLARRLLDPRCAGCGETRGAAPLGAPERAGRRARPANGALKAA